MGMQKLNSNPFTLATSYQSSSPEKTSGQAADSFIRPQPRMRALHSQAASLQRALSKQDYNVNLGALSGIVDVIDESNSAAECGLTSNSLSKWNSAIVEMHVCLLKLIAILHPFSMNSLQFYLNKITI